MELKQLLIASLFGSLQVYRCVRPTQLQPQTCGPAADCPAVCYVDLGTSRGLACAVRHQRRAKSGPQRVQVGEQQLRGLLLCLLILRALPHHAAALLWNISGPQEVGGDEESQAEEQYADQSETRGAD